MAVWYFDPPTVEEGMQPWEVYRNQGRFDHRWGERYFRLKRGYSVWKNASGVWQINRFPTFDDVNYALYFFYGGARSVVSDAIKAEIIAAGLGIDSTYFTEAPAGTELTSAPKGDDHKPMPPMYDAIF